MADLGSRVAAIRARLVDLDARRAQGTLDEAAYDAARRAAERELAEAVVASPDPVVARAAPRPSARLWLALAALVVVIAIGGYAFTGSPRLAGLGTPPAPPDATPEAASEREIGVAQIAAMVDKLAARLKETPDDAEGWKMLARSYTVLNRFDDALPAYRRAVELKPKDAGLVADYADAVAASRGGLQNTESLALIDRALALDPEQPKALALAGTVAFDRGDFAGAAARWQKIADALPPDSEFHKQVMDNIDEARRRGGMPPSAKREAASPTVANRPTGREALTGTVSLAPALAGKVAPTDTVFVLARPEGARMPLAVQRATVADLPLSFRLDDSMAMTPTAKLSTTPRVVVAARISKSGNAITQPGEFGGETESVTPGTSGLVIVIAKEAAPR